jgi:spore germination cell wall hydrolase CwlJ-like protein
MKRIAPVFVMIGWALITVAMASASIRISRSEPVRICTETCMETETETATMPATLPETETTAETTMKEETETESETEPTTEETETQPMFTEEERIMLQKIAWVEAGNVDAQAMAMVMRVVLNRVESPAFPNTIAEVIYQQDQFTPVTLGIYDTAQPNERTAEALALIESGYDGVYGATYFSTPKSEWHRRTLQEICEYRGIIFWKVKEG